MASRGMRRSGGVESSQSNGSTLRTVRAATTGSSITGTSSHLTRGTAIRGRNNTRLTVGISSNPTVTTNTGSSITGTSSHLTRGTAIRGKNTTRLTVGISSNPTVTTNTTNAITPRVRRISSTASRVLPYNIPVPRQPRIETAVGSPLEETQEKVKPRRSIRQESLLPKSPKLINTRLSMACVNVVYCPICLSNVRMQDDLSVVATGCGHLFCEDCIFQALEKRPCCPLCLKTVSKDELREIFL